MAHIEFYDMRIAMLTDFSDTESIESDTSGDQPMGEPKIIAKSASAKIEHWNPELSIQADDFLLTQDEAPTASRATKNDATSSIADETSSFCTKQETKRRKVNGSSKPLKVFDTGAESKSKTKTASLNPRVVQVYSPSGRMAHSFATCSEAARQMDIGRSRIARAIQKGWAINGMIYKHPDPAMPPLPSVPDVEMDVDEE